MTELDLTRVDDLLQEACTSGRIPGVVASFGTADGEHGQWANGFADTGQTEPMPSDGIFRVTSMAKLVTSVAVMQLVERSALDLDAEVRSLLPRFGDLRVIDHFDESGPVLRAPRRPATVRELMAHTSGLSYNTWDSTLMRYEQLTGAPNIGTGRLAALDLPLVADPGVRVSYGTGQDWGGLIVEKLSGLSLDSYCEQYIFGPLGMRRTSMRRPEERGLPVVPVLDAVADGSFVASSREFPRAPEFYFGGGCVYSTSGDYLRLQLALLGDGGNGPTRVLTSPAIEEIFSPQSGSLDIPHMKTQVPADTRDVDLGPGWKWGFGVTLNPKPLPTGRSAGSGAWGGIFNTTFWIDRANGVAANLLMQFRPYRHEQALAVGVEFETALYSALGVAPIARSREATSSQEPDLA